MSAETLGATKAPADAHALQIATADARRAIGNSGNTIDNDVGSSVAPPTP